MSLLLPVRFPFNRSFGGDEILLQSPPNVVDLRDDAVDLACRLSRLSLYLRGARKLLTCYFLSPDEFRKNSRKIVRLVEVAHRTLAGANIFPFSFCCGSSPFHSHKSAYIDLLRMLYDHRHHVDAALQDRLVKLFHPLTLSSPRLRWAGALGVTAERSSEASPEKRPEKSATASMQWPPKPLHHKLVTAPERDISLMPPPDRFSEPDTRYQNRTYRNSGRTQQLWDPEVVFPTSTRGRRKHDSYRESSHQENQPTDMELSRSFRLRPLSRHFGIYCTGKNTMYRQSERANRSGGISSTF